jgi:hypothetical protein
MAMNRVQFQTGLSLAQFMQRYETEAQCEQAVIAARCPSGFICPACGLKQARSICRPHGRLAMGAGVCYA